MEVAQVPNSSTRTGGRENDQLHMKKKTLRSMLEQCQIALESISNNAEDKRVKADVADDDEELSPSTDSETNQLCDALKSTFESPKFMEKLGSIHSSFPQNISAEEGSSWDLVSEKDLWEGVTIDGGNETDQESYVVVRQDDVVEGIACFMAAYLLSLEQTKDLTPNQLQEALSKTFSLKKKKGKLQKAWAGSKVIYNVASWGATAIGIYQNPALIGAASLAFWNSCHVISKLL